MNTKFYSVEYASHPRWMVVDDNPDVLLLMQTALEKLGVGEVKYFRAPRAALAALRDDPAAFQFVITDLEMPDMSGIELYCRLRQLSPSLKVLLSTGSDILTETEAAQKGFCGLLRKPFSIPTLKSILIRAGLPSCSLRKRSGTESEKNFRQSFTQTMALTPA
jgi:DNA-binding NtrC family response regulator